MYLWSYCPVTVGTVCCQWSQTSYDVESSRSLSGYHQIVYWQANGIFFTLCMLAVLEKTYHKRHTLLIVVTTTPIWNFQIMLSLVAISPQYNALCCHHPNRWHWWFWTFEACYQLLEMVFLPWWSHIEGIYLLSQNIVPNRIVIMVANLVQANSVMVTKCTMERVVRMGVVNVVDAGKALTSVDKKGAVQPVVVI